MVAVLEKHMVDEIVRIGRERAPSEACGILLHEPITTDGRWVWELPNRSMNPHDSFEIRGTDIAVLLESIAGDVRGEVVNNLVIWHTHPGGNVGPSWEDLHNKPARLRSLVVSIDEVGGRPTFY